MNDHRLRVAARSALSDSVVATYIPHLGAPAHGDFSTRLARVMMEVSGVRSFGSAALSLGFTASGRVDGYFEEGLKPWDMAAGLLIVREAGGFVTDLAGGGKMFDTRAVCAGNEAIHRRLLGALNGG
jgi:myo-inositol-1(or 4)-monophosphatase